MGDKVQVAESLPEKDPLNQTRFITSIVTQKAIASDDPGWMRHCEIKLPAAWIDQLNSTWTGLTCRPHDSKRPRIKAGS
jgi:hypothetical protein